MIKRIVHAFNVARAALHEHAKRVARSPEWPRVEKQALAAHPACEACGSTVRRQVHHCQPFHLHPELELDLSNLIVLCMGANECHLKIGHGDNFRAYNPAVRADAAEAMAHPDRFAELALKAKRARLT